MKEIEINSKKYGRKLVKVDDHNFEELSKYNWYVYTHGYTFYAARDIYYGKKDGKDVKEMVLIHRQILNMSRGDGKVVDHIDGDGLNNLEENLRICSQSQNVRNMRMTKEFKSNTTSKYKGVHYRKERNSWRAVIHFDNKRIIIGCFKNEIDAAKAYDKKAVELHKEFACLNFPELIDEYKKEIN